MIQALIAACEEAGGLALTPIEFADLIWLAAQLTNSHGAKSPEAKPSQACSVADASDVPGESSTAAPDPDDAKPTEEDHGKNPSEKQGSGENSLPVHIGNVYGRINGIRAVPIRVPAAAALPDRLAIVRSLRPLMRRVPSRMYLVLDEVETAEQTAQQCMVANRASVVPQVSLQPSSQRWLDIVVIVDEWVTMSIWRRTAAEFIELISEWELSVTFRLGV